tara:strand:- start:13813 stop:14943 length:1131 start_codon:yes stop_codon:yes gene_type:complete
MFYSNVDTIITNNKVTKVFEKGIPEDILEKFHKIVNLFLKNKDLIVKGGRSLNNIINIYNKDDLKYSDYDLYSKNPKEDLIKIGKKLTEIGIKNITVDNIIFKPEIFRLSLFNIPLIDVEPVTETEWAKMPKYIVNNITYIENSFQKIDMYSQFGRPTILNISNWDKVYPRLQELNKTKKFELKIKDEIGQKGPISVSNVVKNILDLLGNDCVLTGDIAYCHQMIKYKEDVYFPNLSTIEIFTHNIDKYVKLIKRFDNITVVNHDGFMNMLTKYTVIYQSNKPICYLYYIDDCINYDYIDGRKYSSYSHLMFYYNMINFFEQSDKNDTIMYYLHKKLNDKELHTVFFGNRNPGIVGLHKMFVKKKKDTELVRIINF